MASKGSFFSNTGTDPVLQSVWQDLVNQAEISATAAAASATAAGTSQTAAAAAAATAATDASATASDKTACDTDATNAAASATAASTSATNAASSATAASGSATAASGSASGAATSATNAASSATAAATSATNSASSASAAATSAASINLPSMAGATGLEMLRVVAAHNGYEFRTPAQVVTDLGLPTPSGNALDYIRVNTGGTAFEARTPAQALTDIGFPRDYIDGLILSNDGTLPNTVLDIGAGVAAGSGNAVLIQLGSAFTKSISGAWASGTGSNGMGNGLTIAASTWYHVILANNNGTPDIYFDTSVTGANRPAGISDTKVRRIGSFKTDASVHIMPFTQVGDHFLWAGGPIDVNGVASSATSALVTLSVPSGVKVFAEVRTEAITSASAQVSIVFTSPDETDQAAQNGVCDLFVSNVTVVAAADTCKRTNTSGQIRVRSTGTGCNVFITTYGWRDLRGKN